MATNQRLSIMALPQYFNGTELSLNIVVLPRDHNPLNPIIKPDLGGEEAPAFADAELSFTANLFHGFANAHPNNTPDVGNLVINSVTPVNARDIFGALASHMEIHNPDMINSNANLDAIPTELKLEEAVEEARSVKKYLPKSYRAAFNYTSPRTKNAVTDDSYHCAVKDGKFVPGFQQSSNVVSWGQVFAFLLRQPSMAEQAGLIYKTTLTIAPDFFPEGGWLYVDLAEGSDYKTQQNADPIFIKKYAARIPVLEPGVERQVFAPLLFPVTDVLPPGFDKLYIEAAEYDDGFAKIVHCQQPPHRDLLVEETEGFYPIKDVGVRLGWDDEQLLIWYMRQLTEDINSAELHKRLDAPLGVFGYNIDVREKDATLEANQGWESLNLVASKQPLALSRQANVPNDFIELGNFEGELPYQVYPIQLDGRKDQNFWLPMYFAGWNGHNMVLPDEEAASIYQTTNPRVLGDEEMPAQIDGSPTYDDGNAITTGTGATGPAQNQLNSIYNSGQITTELRYGNSYEFRIRMQDLSGGSPPLNSGPINETSSDIAECDFKRYITPLQPRLAEFGPVENPEDHTILNTDTPSRLTALNISRPKLGYPAVVFTGKYTDAVQRLMDQSQLGIQPFDATNPLDNFEHRVGLGIADPDVDRLEITVEVESLKLDKLDSISGKDDYVHLYTTTRPFPFDANNEDSFELPIDLAIEYQDVNVLNDSDDLTGNVHDGALKLPTARTIRLTLRAVCQNVADIDENDISHTYYGIIDEGNKQLDVRYGEPFQMKVYSPSEDETGLLIQTAGVPQIQGIYMRSDIAAPFDGLLTTALFGKESGQQINALQQNNNVQQLADQLNLESTGLTLNAAKGQRVVFGCSSRIRHTMAPDRSSITFASKGDLINHWLCCISLEIDRDWMWDAMQTKSLVIKRTKKFTQNNEPESENAEIGAVELYRTASFEALDNPQRNVTRIVFIDAVEPKKSKDESNIFPDTIAVDYTIETQFKEGHAAQQDEAEELHLSLPITTPPAQVPKIASAGLALSPYVRDEKYSFSESRRRYLWIEFEEPVADPQDSYFARVLSNRPDQLISNNHPSLLLAPEDSPLPIDPEQIRIVSPASANDLAGLNAMQPMLKGSSDLHYILPLPPGLHANSDEMFGFFTYEFRVGHYERTDEDTENPMKVWTTAQGRFGRRLKAHGIQHPAPNLSCMPNRDEEKLWVTAPYAVAVHDGKNVTADPPRTELWALLYAQVKQADNLDYRNILLDDRPLDWRVQIEKEKEVDILEKYTKDELQLLRNISSRTLKAKVAVSETSNYLKLVDFTNKNKSSTKIGTTIWSNKKVAQLLATCGLPKDSGLSVVVVETLPQIKNIFDHISGLQLPSVAAATERFVGNEHKKTVFARNGNDKATIDVDRPSPVSDELGHHRIMRTSPLTKVPEVCCTDC